MVAKIPKVGKVTKVSAKSGLPMNPVTKMKMNNNIPGLKSGGGVCKKCGCKCTASGKCKCK